MKLVGFDWINLGTTDLADFTFELQKKKKGILNLHGI